MASGSLFVGVLCTLIVFSVASVSKREVSVELFPDCRQYNSCMDAIGQNDTFGNTSFPNLAYIRAVAADDDKDVLHYVMTTIGFPSILMVHTTQADSYLHFDWDRLLLENKTDIAGAINATTDINYSFMIVFSKLLEYDDLHDAASLTSADGLESKYWVVRNFTDFSWMNMTLGNGKTSVIFNTTFPQPTPYGNDTQGSLSFEFEINNSGGRDDDLPRLIYNANNTQFNFVLDGYVPSFNKSRFALELSIVANKSDRGMNVEETKSIDDEYSPGVFRMVNWYSRGNTDDTGYLQWKPVCYLEAGRGRAAGTEVVKYPLKDPSDVPGLDDLLEQSLARAFYGDAMKQPAVVVKSSNVSFGLSQDGFYLKNNYTVWTASVGYGSAPVESISTLVIIIIAAGLGLPVILILIGSIYVCVKRSRGDYTEIGSNDDEDNVSRENPRLN